MRQSAARCLSQLTIIAACCVSLMGCGSDDKERAPVIGAPTGPTPVVSEGGAVNGAGSGGQLGGVSTGLGGTSSFGGSNGTGFGTGTGLGGDGFGGSGFGVNGNAGSGTFGVGNGFAGVGQFGAAGGLGFGGAGSF